MKRALLCMVVGGMAVGEAQAESDYTLTLESGSEFDSNIHRFENTDDPDRPVKGDLLLRLGARYRGSVQSEGHGGSLAIAGLLKAFGSASGQSENSLVLQIDGSYFRAISDTLRLGGRASAFDVEHFAIIDDPDLPARTFATAGGEAFLERAEGEHRIRLSGGLRGFSYGPDENYDWFGEEVGLSYRTRFWSGNPDDDLEASSLDLQARYRLQRRDHTGHAIDNTCGTGADLVATCLKVSDEGRIDGNHLLGLDLLLTTRRIYSLRYDFEFNRSNSFGNSFARHRVEARFTSELGRSGFFATVTGTVLLNHFLDPLLLAQDVTMQSFVSIEDENRNGLALGITKDLTPRWTLETRYAFYTNEFVGDAVPFRRHTLYGGLMVRLDDP